MIVITRSGKLDEWLKFRQQIIIGVELLNGHDHKMLSKSVYDSIWLSSRHFFLYMLVLINAVQSNKPISIFHSHEIRKTVVIMFSMLHWLLRCGCWSMIAARCFFFFSLPPFRAQHLSVHITCYYDKPSIIVVVCICLVNVWSMCYCRASPRPNKFNRR